MSGLFSLKGFGRYCVSIVVVASLSLSAVRFTLANEIRDSGLSLNSEPSLDSGLSLNSGLSLETVLHTVKQNDFRLKQYAEASKAYVAESQAQSYLPDPTLFAAIQNLPVDTFEFDQEPMSQVRVGLRQMFPKGELLSIKSDMSGIQSELQVIASQQRWLMRKKQSEQAWLDAWYWQKNLALLKEDEVFLKQVQQFIQSLYEVGEKGQSDLIGADLELIKLDEKRIEAKRNFQNYRQQLDTLANKRLAGGELQFVLPDLDAIGLEGLDQDEIDRYIANHPRVQLQAAKIRLADKKVDMTAQDFEPAWGVELSYGLRDGENMDGSDRPDFFSAGVNVQIPLFSDGKQRQNQEAAIQRSRVEQIRRDEVISEMRFELANLVQQLRSTKEQRSLYERDILPTLENQRLSALQSYESDQGDLRLVMSLFLKEQSAKAMHLRLRINEQKLISSLNYLIGLDSTLAKDGAS